MAEFKYIVRIVNTDLNGHKPIQVAMRKIKGVGYMLASAILNVVNVSKVARTGDLSQEDIDKIDDALRNLESQSLPTWLYNRRKDPETGEDKHLVTSDLRFTKDNDIKLLKKIKSYRGYRHAFGLPTRGQRTRSNFRRNKGKVTGVKRAKKGKTGK